MLFINILYIYSEMFQCIRIIFLVCLLQFQIAFNFGEVLFSPRLMSFDVTCPLYLRQELCLQIIDRKIQAITRILFRLIGRLVLRGGGGGGGGGGGDSSDDDDRRVQITLPSFPPSADDEDEDEDSTGEASEDATTTTTEPVTDLCHHSYALR